MLVNEETYEMLRQMEHIASESPPMGPEVARLFYASLLEHRRIIAEHEGCEAERRALEFYANRHPGA